MERVKDEMKRYSAEMVDTMRDLDTVKSDIVNQVQMLLAKNNFSLYAVIKPWEEEAAKKAKKLREG